MKAASNFGRLERENVRLEVLEILVTSLLEACRIFREGAE